MGNDDLQASVARLQRRVDDLARRLDALEGRSQQPATGDALDDKSVKILLHIANCQNEAAQNQTIYLLQLGKVEGECYFDQLRKRKFIVQSKISMGSEVYYSATPAGREYLMRHGHLK